MATRSRGWVVALAACLMLAFAGVAAAQYSVVAVTPDNVILRGPSGIHSYQVPAGTMFNADGKSVSVSELKPGMKLTGMESGIASWKTSDVMVHEELNAEVVAVAGNSLLIKGSKGVEKYEWKESSDIAIVKDGKMVDASALHVGDRITGMIVQKAVPGAPKAAAAPDTSAADAAAKKAAADKAAADAAAKKAAADKAAADKAAADAAAKKAAADKAAADKAAADKAAADKAAADKAAADAAASKKKLPKTASEVPLAGLAGVLALAAGAGLTAIRKSRSAK